MKTEMQKRTKQLIVRVSKDELLTIDRLARERKMRRATFMRHSIIDKIPPVIPLPNQDMAHELFRIGNNVNQIARRSNMNLSVDINETRDALINLRKILLGMTS